MGPGDGEGHGPKSLRVLTGIPRVGPACPKHSGPVQTEKVAIVGMASLLPHTGGWWVSPDFHVETSSCHTKTGMF